MKKTKFTLIDAAITVVVLAVLAVGAKMLASRRGGGDGVVEFSVMASLCDEGIGDIVGIGDEVSISFSEQAFATVTAVEEVPQKENVFNNMKGEYAVQEVKGKSEVKITLECPAEISDTKISNGNVPIRVGSEMPVRGKGYTVKGYVVEVEEKQGGAENDN